jgi:hypothetical protein
MANVFKRFVKGILLAGETTVPSDNKNGSIFYHSSDSRIKTYVEDAVREIVTNSQNQNLTNKTISASSNSILTAASGNLSSTELNAALSELQSDIDTRVSQAALTAHINDFSGAHDAAAISFDKLPYTITSNDVQGAIGETWVTLQGHIADSSDAHDASAISVIPSGTLASTDVQAALQELQTDVDSRVTTASNVGTGSGVFKQKSGSTLELKSLSAGSNITITEVGDSLQLSASGTIGVNDATTSVKGILKLAGDLSGTADLPTVVSATTSTKGIVKLAGDLGGTADLPKIIKPTSTVSLLDVDWSLGYVHYKEISANSTFTFSNLEDGKIISLIIKNTGAATYNITLPTVIKTASMDLTIQAGKQNVYTFIATSTSVYATAVTQMA